MDALARRGSAASWGWWSVGTGVEVAGLPCTPDQLREDDQAGECEEAQDGGCGVLDPFETEKKFLPEKGDRDKGEKADARNEVGEPIGNVEAGEVANGVEKDRRQSEKKGRPDDDAERAGPFGDKEKPGEEERKGDDVDDGWNDDGGGRTN